MNTMFGTRFAPTQIPKSPVAIQMKVTTAVSTIRRKAINCRIIIFQSRSKTTAPTTCRSRQRQCQAQCPKHVADKPRDYSTLRRETTVKKTRRHTLDHKLKRGTANLSQLPFQPVEQEYALASLQRRSLLGGRGFITSGWFWSVITFPSPQAFAEAGQAHDSFTTRT